MTMQTVGGSPAPVEFTNLDEIAAIVADARAAFDDGRTRPLQWRLEQLDGVLRLLKEREADILAALKLDVGKPELEAYGAEVAYTATEVRTLRKNLRKWASPDKVKSPIVVQPAKSRIYKDPLGVVLVIAPWNYPFQLAMAPLVGALAAGNAVVLKPSEVAPATSRLMAELLPRYLDAQAVKVVEGAVDETTRLLEQRFDHIFYTGNGTVARIIMTAAAKHLTPVTLELGGKSPTIIDEDVDLELAVRRIVMGKFYNAGQICIAPDYVLCHERVAPRALDLMKKTVIEFYGADPQKSEDYARIVNERHHARIMRLMASGTPVVGGQADVADRYIAPTVLKDVAPDSPVMSEEIFGPILPVLTVANIDEAIRFVNARDKPLALYLFTRNPQARDAVLERTSSGGAVVNHIWMHFVNHELPFGGVGESGMGAYHGKASFDTFVHKKSVLEKTTTIDPPVMYPPFNERKRKLIKRLL